MPNMTNRNKRGNPQIPRANAPNPHRKPDSVKDLLTRATATLTRVSDQNARQTRWSAWLNEHLPADLSARISGVVEREGTLVIFAESAAWSARLRYAVLEVEAQIKQTRPAIQQVSVRVLPRR